MILSFVHRCGILILFMTSQFALTSSSFLDRAFALQPSPVVSIIIASAIYAIDRLRVIETNPKSFPRCSSSATA
jgi:hypothetical protein